MKHTHTPLCEPHQCKRPRSWCDRCWGRWPAAAGPGRTWSGATRCLRSDSASPAPTSQRPGPRRCLRSRWCARGARQLPGSPGPPGCSDRLGPAGWRRWCPPRRGSPSWRQERKNNQSVCWLWVTVKSSCSHVISRPCFCKHLREIMEIQTQKKMTHNTAEPSEVLLSNTKPETRGRRRIPSHCEAVRKTHSGFGFALCGRGEKQHWPKIKK